ncbi:MAG TPA: J domain-containing protein [Burkholderiaceae bacterium]
MTSNEVLTIVGCGLLGYGVVHFFLRKAPDEPVARAPAPAPAPVPPHWTTVLELSPDASVEEIRDAYRRLISQYHPDKVASLGRELQELADAKSKEIALAYQAALLERGGAR